MIFKKKKTFNLLVFQTPNDPNRIFCPIPNSIKNNGMPSNINIVMNGMRKAPENKNKKNEITN